MTNGFESAVEAVLAESLPVLEGFAMDLNSVVQLAADSILKRRKIKRKFREI